MQSFPLIRDLSQSVITTGWSWERFDAPSMPSSNFWLGTDHAGNRWLTKLRGSFYAYREIVFARLAQAMKWSCQSSVFLVLDEVAASTLGATRGDIHAAHWFMPEHKSQPCSGDCALRFLCDKEIRMVDDLVGSQIAHLMDWPKSEYAAYLFGGGEPPGRLFTTEHEFVIIDSEQMFSTGPCKFDTAHWWNNPDRQPSRSGRELAAQVCADLASLTTREIEDALRVPKGVQIRESWPIARNLQASYEFASSYCSSSSRSF